ncbi:hypothetical protein P691DRAFT_811229 [Macrolepiota fuliginosa MF-IS2]|uniref:Uncharacterized protein n=1 Tax=Macrolepiota fuliginosa MF-IS2 TaxID=1400762 RepID=A0A9P5X0V0_9AGAR|nr:hypothetical protein P691DRAFT_811229 [Macrolepiota fuliginosa MF-IS2]
MSRRALAGEAILVTLASWRLLNRSLNLAPTHGRFLATALAAPTLSFNGTFGGDAAGHSLLSAVQSIIAQGIPRKNKQYQAESQNMLIGQAGVISS